MALFAPGRLNRDSTGSKMNRVGRVIFLSQKKKPGDTIVLPHPIRSVALPARQFALLDRGFRRGEALDVINIRVTAWGDNVGEDLASTVVGHDREK